MKDCMLFINKEFYLCLDYEDFNCGGHADGSKIIG